MLIVVGIAALMFLALALFALAERTHEREVLEEARTVLERARRRTAGHSARLTDISRAASHHDREAAPPA